MEIEEKFLGYHPSVLLFGDLAEDTSADLLWWLGYWQDHDPNRRLSVFIDSRGGDLFAATAVAEAFRVSPNPIATVTIGRCYSGAALVAASGDRGQRWAYKTADFMIHQLQITNTETTSIVKKEADTVWEKRLNSAFLKLLSEATGRPLARVRKDTKYEKYMDANQALEYGLVDHIAKWKKTPEKKS